MSYVPCFTIYVSRSFFSAICSAFDNLSHNVHLVRVTMQALCYMNGFGALENRDRRATLKVGREERGLTSNSEWGGGGAEKTFSQ